MEILIIIAVCSVAFGFSLWLSLKILESGNSRNSLGLAIFIGIFFSLPTVFEIGLYGNIFSLVALLLLLLNFYDLGFIKTFIAIIIMGVIQEFCGKVFIGIVNSIAG